MLIKYINSINSEKKFLYYKTYVGMTPMNVNRHHYTNLLQDEDKAIHVTGLDRP